MENKYNFYYTSNLKIAGFVLNFRPNQLLANGQTMMQYAKQSILEATREFGDEDMVCLYKNEDMDVAMSRAEIVAEISNYPEDSSVDLGLATLNVAKIFSELDEDFKYKNIFILSNLFISKNFYHFSKAHKINEYSWPQSKFYFIDFSEEQNLDFVNFAKDQNFNLARYKDLDKLENYIFDLLNVVDQ